MSAGLYSTRQAVPRGPGPEQSRQKLGTLGEGRGYRVSLWITARSWHRCARSFTCIVSFGPHDSPMGCSYHSHFPRKEAEARRVIGPGRNGSNSEPGLSPFSASPPASAAVHMSANISGRFCVQDSAVWSGPPPGPQDTLRFITVVPCI